MKLYTVLPNRWFILFPSRKDCIRAQFRLRDIHLLNQKLPQFAHSKAMSQAVNIKPSPYGQFSEFHLNPGYVKELVQYLGSVGTLNPGTNFMLLQSKGSYHEVVGDCFGWFHSEDFSAFEEITSVHS